MVCLLLLRTPPIDDGIEHRVCSGGGLDVDVRFTSTDSYLLLENCVWTGNYAGTYGAILLQAGMGQQANLLTALVVFLSVRSGGGMVFASANGDGAVMFKNCTWTNNTASIDGIYFVAASSPVIELTFACSADDVVLPAP